MRRLRLESQCDLWGDVEYRGPSFGLEAIYDDVESNLDKPALVEEVGAQEERVALHLNELPLISKPAKRKRRTGEPFFRAPFVAQD